MPDPDTRIAELQETIEDALGNLTLYMEAQDVLAYVERIAERMHEELAGQ